MSNIRISKNRNVALYARVDISVSCKMDFKSYPLDGHECPFRVGSYYSTEDTVKCTSEYELDTGTLRSLQYFLEIESLPEKYRVSVFKNKRYAACGVNILLQRTRKQIFFQ